MLLVPELHALLLRLSGRKQQQQNFGRLSPDVRRHAWRDERRTLPPVGVYKDQGFQTVPLTAPSIYLVGAIGPDFFDSGTVLRQAIFHYFAG